MKKNIYDEYYQKPGYFGKPYPELVQFFKLFDKNQTILDLGCGQGRDLIFLANMGFNLIGVDHSKVGLDQIKSKAQDLGLKVELEVADIYKYRIPETVDMVLMDSMFHFYKNDIQKETELLDSILNQLKIDGLLCNCLIRGKNREIILKKIIEKSPFEWEIVHESYIKYPEYNSEYHFMVIKKEARK